MPGGDRTGPLGMGSMTGRGAGQCAGYASPKFRNPVSDRGFGAGRGIGCGRGAGFGRNRGRVSAGYAQAPATGSELESLKSEARTHQGALEMIQQRIDKLENQPVSE